MASKYTKNFLFKFLGDTKSLEKAAQRAERSLGGMDGQVSRSDKALAGLKRGAGLLGGVLATGALAKGLTSAVNRAEEMDSKYAITRQIIEETGGAANLSAIQIENMAREMSQTTGLDKAVATEAANVLLTFKELRDVAGEGNDVFSRAHDITADMATVFGGSAVDASKQLGKALNDPIGGVSALSRVGVQFTDQQKEQIRTLVESGDVLSAQKLILDELESQVGGTAEASADATAQMKAGFAELSEAIGAELLPLIQDLTPHIVNFTNAAADAFGNLGLGVQHIDRMGSAVADFFTLGAAEAWTEADEALYKFTQTAGYAVEQLQAGREAGQVAGEWMIHLAKEGALTADTMARIAETTGVADETLVDVRHSIEDMSAELGLNEEQLAAVLDVTDDLAHKVARDAVAAEEDFAESARETAGALMAQTDATDDAADATSNFRAEMNSLTDPVRAAERAVTDYETALEEANEDGIVTKDEALEISGAFGDMHAALSEISPENLIALRDQMVDSGAVTKAEADKIIQNLRAIDRTEVSPEYSGFEDLVGRLEQLTGRPIQIDMAGLRVATSAEIEQAVNRAIYAGIRNGQFALIPL